MYITLIVLAAIAGYPIARTICATLRACGVEL